MSIADDLRAKAGEMGEAIRDAAQISPSSPEVLEVSNGMLLNQTIYECTAALIDSLPNERERAELAALTGVLASHEFFSSGEKRIGCIRMVIDELLEQRQADADQDGAK